MNRKYIYQIELGTYEKEDADDVYRMLREAIDKHAQDTGLVRWFSLSMLAEERQYGTPPEDMD